MSIPLLVVIELAPENLSRIEDAGFELHVAPTVSERAAVIQAVGDSIRAV
ncbi:hypothetical protein [Methylobacterium aquaticum]|uniref:Uncharacterized protein n=1 Tax=Methylobacterium ajmalii TaxID=2738439 RepID=A0ABU9ZNM0_9HYPH|nr:hypothetical protein [Methylobacterium aquaticum]